MRPLLRCSESTTDRSNEPNAEVEREMGGDANSGFNGTGGDVEAAAAVCLLIDEWGRADGVEHMASNSTQSTTAGTGWNRRRGRGVW